MYVSVYVGPFMLLYECRYVWICVAVSPINQSIYLSAGLSACLPVYLSLSRSIYHLLINIALYTDRCGLSKSILKTCKVNIMSDLGFLLFQVKNVKFIGIY